MAAPPTLQLAPVDREALLTQDLLAPTGTPLRYAAVRDPGVSMRRGVATAGAWTDMRNAQGAPMRRWSLTVTTPGALSQDFGFAQLFLPHGASLILRGADGRIARGPYTDADVAAAQRFQTPFVEGDTATIEIDVPTALARHVSFALDRVAPAHRDIFSSDGGLAKSGSCNVDVQCPQGVPYPDQINSVARYSFDGFLCTGALINNVAADRALYFLTANHCVDTQNEAASMVFYWKYENPGCRTPGSGASGTPIALAGNSIAQTGGADLRAGEDDSDFTLVRLRSAVPTAANGFLAGWDRRNIAPSSAFTIHHPQGHEKRISFDNGPLQIFDRSAPGLSFGNSFLRVVNYELGTTEGGSSGAPLFTTERRIVGQLAGGAALCSVPEGDDYFGRLFTSFTRGTTAATRLSDWLDPANTGAQTLDGVSIAGGCTPPAAVLSAPATALAGVPVNISLTLPAGTYRVEWDIDGDGSVDRVNAAASGTIVLQPVYPTEASVTLMVRVIGSGGCTSVLQRALVVDGPRVSAVPFSSPQQLCGDGDAAVEPGERWRVAVSFRNDGAKGLTDAHGVFAPVDPASIRLETPALAIASLGANGAAIAGLMDFAIPTSATCGSVAAIRYLGTLDRSAWSIQQESTPFSITLGGGGPCNVITACPAQIVPIVPNVGLFGNLERFGNGIGTFVTDNPDPAPPVLFGAWFTGTRARTPLWYTLQGFLVDNRSDVEFRQFRRTSENPFTVAPTVVGTGQVTYLGPNDYLLRFNVNGQSGLERQTLELPDTTVAPDHTGVWHFPPESGSGYVVDTHRNAGVPEELVITFIYGTDNEPRWTFGSKAIAQSGPITEDTFEVHCPSCPSLVDFLETRVFAGNLSPIFSTRTTGTLSTNLFVSTPFSLLWIRNNIPIEMISTPRP
ncbi:MAG: trypsin-like peptidase domain-containing protein [Lysobacterales bacterium]